MFLTLNFFICFLINLMLLLVDNNFTSKFLEFLDIIFNVVLPIEPVEPKIPIIFSLI